MASNAASAASDGGSSAARPILDIAGTSAKALAGKVTAVAAFNRFLRSTSKYGSAPFDALSGEVLSDQPIWREFAHFLCDAEADGDKKGCTPSWNTSARRSEWLAQVLETEGARGVLHAIAGRGRRDELVQEHEPPGESAVFGHIAVEWCCRVIVCDAT